MCILPEDILHLIYKKYYSIHVLGELLHRPGNFAFMYNTKLSNTSDGIKWIYSIQRDYNTINKMGTKGWEYINIQICSDFFHPLINHIKSDILYNLQIIGKFGWNSWKKSIIENN